MAKVGITETVLRDAHQSLIATRMTTEEMLPALEQLDDIFPIDDKYGNQCAHM